MKKTIDYLIVIVTTLMLFCVSNSIKLGPITHPKFLGIFFFLSLIYLFVTKRITIDDLKKKSFVNYMSFGMLILSFVAFLSIFINKQVSVTNIFEIFRPIVYAISLVVLTNIFKEGNARKLFNKIFCGLVLVLFVFNVIQFYNFGNINDLYIKVIAPTQYSTLVNGYAYPRIVGFIGNPNEYGFVLSLFNLFLIYSLVKSKTKKKVIFLIIALLLNKLGMLFTGSRTAYLSMIASEFFFTFFVYYFDKKNKFIMRVKRALIPCLCLFVLEAGMMFLTPSKYNWRIKEIFSGQIKSWEKRKKSTQDIMDNLLEEDTSKVDEEKEDISKDDKTKEEMDLKNKPSKTVDEIEHQDDKISDDNSIVEIKPEPKEIETEDKKEVSLKSRIVRILLGKAPLKNGFAFDNEWVHLFVTYGIIGILAYFSIYVFSLLDLKKMTSRFKCFYISILLLNFIYMIAAGSFFSYTLYLSLILFIAYIYECECYEKK